MSGEAARPRTRLIDRLPAWLAPLTALAVAGLGLLSRWLVVDPLLAAGTIPEVEARALSATLTLVFAIAALLAFGATLLAVYLIQRPVRELAERIALAGMAEVPLTVEVMGSEALRLVAQRYNSLAQAVAHNSALLRDHAKQQRQRADEVEGIADLVLAGVPSGILAVGADGRVVRVNDAALEILGLKRAQLVEQQLELVLGAQHPVARAAQQQSRRDEVQVGDSAQALVLGVSSGAVRNAGGDIIGHVVIFADLTDLRRLEQELELKQRLASLGELAAGLAHEVRNPLGAMRGFVELLQRRLDEPARARPLLEKILKEIEALASVIGDFLAFARPAPPRRAPVAVADLLAEVLETGRAAAGHPDVATSVVPLDAELNVLADAAQVRRALVNFVLNALQAVGPGGHIVLGARQTDRRVELYVEDDGPGVEEELRGKLGTPFVSTKQGGTGLGLAVVHQIAQAHGGALLLEQPATGGARFVLSLPTTPDDGAAA